MFGKLKSILLLLLIAVLIIFLLNSNNSELTNIWIEHIKNQPPTTARVAMVMDAETGEIIYTKNSNVSVPVASISKIMTEFIILEAIKDKEISWKQKVKVSHHVEIMSTAPDLANIPLLQIQTYTVRELFEAMSIYSANAATVALAELISGSEEEFVKTMNETSEKLGFKDSHFVNCTGLTNKMNNDQNEMSAEDVAELTKILINKHPEIIKIAGVPHATFQSGGTQIEMVNRNEMLNGLNFAYEGMDGLKTGYTDAAGYSFVGTAARGNKRLISVILNTVDSNERFLETKKLLDYGFEQVN